MTTPLTLSARAWLELLLLGVIWGGVFLATRIALDEIGVFHVVAHRVLWASLILWIYVFVRRLAIPWDVKTWGAFLVMGLLNNALPFTLMAWGQQYIESSLTAIFNAATAIFGVLVAAMLFADERLTRRKVVGVGIGFLGVVIAIGPEAIFRFDPRSLAQLAILAGALSYAFAGAWARRHLNHLPPQVAATGMLTASSLLLVPLAIMVEGPLPLMMSPATTLAIAFYSVIATAFAYLLYYRVLATAGSGNLMLVTLVIPPVAIGLGAAFRNESLGANALAGFAALALGLVVLDGRWRGLFKRRTA